MQRLHVSVVGVWLHGLPVLDAEPEGLFSAWQGVGYDDRAGDITGGGGGDAEGAPLKAGTGTIIPANNVLLTAGNPTKFARKIVQLLAVEDVHGLPPSQATLLIDGQGRFALWSVMRFHRGCARSATFP